MVCVSWWWLQWKPMYSKRNPIPKVGLEPVALGRVLRSCLTESQLPFLCISGQKLDKSWILMCKLEEKLRQLQVTGVQVPSLSQPDAHIMLPKYCLATAPPLQNVILLLLLQHNRRKKRINTLLNLKSSHCQRQCYSHCRTHSSINGNPFWSLIWPDLSRTSISHIFLGPFLAEYP